MAPKIIEEVFKTSSSATLPIPTVIPTPAIYEKSSDVGNRTLW